MLFCLRLASDQWIIMEDTVKAIIWASPRTCSTALLKCLSGIPNSKMFDELYTIAFLFGPERLDPTPPDEEPPTAECYDAFPSSICTYDWIKTILEKDYPGKKAVLSKEISYCLNQRYDSIPEGYRHVFLLRHPSKVFPSWKKLTIEVMTDFLKKQEPISMEDYDFNQQPPHILPPGYAFKEAYDLFEYVKEKKLDENPIIIEADDLVNDPAAILSALCGKLGLPYSDSLLTWDKGTHVVDTWTLGNKLKWSSNMPTVLRTFATVPPQETGHTNLCKARWSQSDCWYQVLHRF